MQRPVPLEYEKRMDTNGCCHTCGYGVIIGHTSENCRYKNPGHKDDATREETIGGNTINQVWNSTIE